MASPDPLDDLGDLTFGATGDMPSHRHLAYTHVSLLDESQRSEDVGVGPYSPALPPARSPAPSPAVASPLISSSPLQPPPPYPADPLLQPAMPHKPSGSLFDDEPLSPPAPDEPGTSASSEVQPASPLSGPSPARLPSNTSGRDEGGSSSEIRPDLFSSEVEGLPLPDTPVRLWVREPEKVDVTNKLGMKTSYFAYLVRTESTLPSLRVSGVEVRRRFSEFEALHRVIKLWYRGYFIPPLPEKSFIEAKIANDEFLRLRRADLQAFLRGVAAHPALRESEALHIFVTQSGELANCTEWSNLVHHPPPSVTRPGSGLVATSNNGDGSDASALAPGNAVKAVINLASWIKHSVGVGVPIRELSEEEQVLRKNKELIGDLERLLDLTCASARSLCGHMTAVCGDFHDLSRNMGMLTRYEEAVQVKNGQYTDVGTAAAGRAEDVQRMAYAAAKQNKLWKTLSLKSAASLVSLHDYMILMPEVVVALEEREAVLAHIWSLEDELTAKQQALVAATGAKANNREKRTYILNQAIANIEEQIKVAREEYRVIKSRNQSELSRLGLERGSDFRRMMGYFSATQAELLRVSSSMWALTAAQYGYRPAE